MQTAHAFTGTDYQSLNRQTVGRSLQVQYNSYSRYIIYCRVFSRDSSVYHQGWCSVVDSHFLSLRNFL
uniref:Uncharacterized protein n=1 Tax=Anguilla anguilla TaxID=7936 RepID=A0A0E9V4S6_ANGAN